MSEKNTLPNNHRKPNTVAANTQRNSTNKALKLVASNANDNGKDETMLSVFISSDTRRTLDLLKLALGKSFKEIVSDAVADYADANKDKIKSYINII